MARLTPERIRSAFDGRNKDVAAESLWSEHFDEVTEIRTELVLRLRQVCDLKEALWMADKCLRHEATHEEAVRCSQAIDQLLVGETGNTKKQ